MLQTYPRLGIHNDVGSQRCRTVEQSCRSVSPPPLTLSKFSASHVIVPWVNCFRISDLETGTTLEQSGSQSKKKTISYVAVLGFSVGFLDLGTPGSPHRSHTRKATFCCHEVQPGHVYVAHIHWSMPISNAAQRLRLNISTISSLLHILKHAMHHILFFRKTTLPVYWE